MKRFIGIILTITLLTTMSTLVLAEEMQGDYLNEAQTLWIFDLFDGYSSTSFEPGLLDMATREQGIKLIAVALNWDIDFTVNSRYSDVAIWAQPYVAQAVELGVTNGKSPTTFGGEDSLTAKELCTWLLRAMGHGLTEAWTDTEVLNSGEAYIYEYLDGDGQQAINRDHLVYYLSKYIFGARPMESHFTLFVHHVMNNPAHYEYALEKGNLYELYTRDYFDNMENKESRWITEFYYYMDGTMIPTEFFGTILDDMGLTATNIYAGYTE